MLKPEYYYIINNLDPELVGTQHAQLQELLRQYTLDNIGRAINNQIDMMEEIIDTGEVKTLTSQDGTQVTIGPDEAPMYLDQALVFAVGLEHLKRYPEGAVPPEQIRRIPELTTEENNILAEYNDCLYAYQNRVQPEPAEPEVTSRELEVKPKKTMFNKYQKYLSKRGN